MPQEISLTFEKGEFKLSDGGETKVKKGDKDELHKIYWNINNSPNELEEIRAFWIEGKTTQKHPFEKDPPKVFDTELKLKVDKKAPVAVWEYKIWWKDHWNQTKMHDPKISVLPSDGLSLKKIIVPLTVLVASLVGAKLFGAKIKKKLFR